MSQTNILLESGTNELEIVEFYIDEPTDSTQYQALSSQSLGEEKTNSVHIREGVYRGYYGVNVAKILEIIQVPKITPLPEVANSAVLGAFNMRSRITPLVDLSTWLDKLHLEDEQPPKAVVTEFNNTTTAFLVSGVNRIHRISWAEVEPPSAYMSHMSSGCITGIVKLEERIIFLLDLEKIVTELNPNAAMRLDEDVSWDRGVRYRALIADDSTLIREMLKDLLEKANFEVVSVDNGRKAWDELCAAKEKAIAEGGSVLDSYQIVVSDIEMPSMDGHTLCRQIKEDSELKKLPVILFSSLITERLRHKGDAVGADEQISKPEITNLAQKAYDLIEEYKKK